MHSVEDSEWTIYHRNDCPWYLSKELGFELENFERRSVKRHKQPNAGVGSKQKNHDVTKSKSKGVRSSNVHLGDDFHNRFFVIVYRFIRIRFGTGRLLFYFIQVLRTRGDHDIRWVASFFGVRGVKCSFYSEMATGSWRRRGRLRWG